MKKSHTGPLWDVLDRRVVYKADPWMEVALETVETDSGHVVKDYHQLTLPDFVVVVAETVNEKVICLRQYKHGLRDVSLTFPGGMVDKGEPPINAVQRELLEETGYAAPTWHHLGSFTVHGNLGAGRGHFFSARGAFAARTPASGDLESMALELKSWKDMSHCAAAGEVKLLYHIAALRLAAPHGLLFTPITSRAAQ
ncbi:MAG: NUDIX hydrolase [Magnetovibrio sp.]|nr:NUDIX hydrolase [Magnetovibrio sp.]